MQYHFEPGLKIELCSFDEQCPAENHFASEREAASTLEMAERISDRNFHSPITGVSGADLKYTLETIANRNPRSYWSNPARALKDKYSEQELQRILQLLARDGILNAVYQTEIQFVDGVEKPLSSGILWKVKTRSWGGSKEISLASSLTLSDRGNEILDGFEAQAAESTEARRLISHLEEDGRKIGDFNADLAQLLEHSDEILKRAGTKILDQAQQLIDEASGSQYCWTRASIAEKFGCSISTATDIATKLTAWGILERTNIRDFGSTRYIIAYRVASGPIAVLGGLSKIIAGAKASLEGDKKQPSAN